MNICVKGPLLIIDIFHVGFTLELCASSSEPQVKNELKGDLSCSTCARWIGHARAHGQYQESNWCHIYVPRAHGACAGCVTSMSMCGKCSFLVFSVFFFFDMFLGLGTEFPNMHCLQSLPKPHWSSFLVFHNFHEMSCLPNYIIYQ
jgi:hypothetical protein